MYRIRFHGRGGQGMKTASRILGSALFREGFEVQDAPRYGAERRGAPMFAYVRAQRQAINERGIISRPDLVVLSDDSLIAMPAAGVASGLTSTTPLLICTSRPASFYQKRYDLGGPILVFALPATASSQAPLSSCCAAAAAALLGVISPENLTAAVTAELGSLPEPLLTENRQAATTVFAQLKDQHGLVREGPDHLPLGQPAWLDLKLEAASRAAPAIHAPATSLKMNTGLWRTLRPEIDHTICISCGLCATFCPDNAISMDADHKPIIDYGHCKGCLICLAQCPARAISTRPEQQAAQEEEA